MANIVSEILDSIDETSAGVVSSAFAALGGEFLPFVQVMMIVAVAMFGMSLWFGIISTPIADFAKKAFIWITCLSILANWLYFDIFFYQIFTESPDEIGFLLLESIDPSITSSGEITSAFGTVLENGIIASGAAFASDGWFLPIVIGALIFIGTIGVVGYALALIILSKVAMACVLAIGPIFIMFLMFDMTRQMFSSWLQQLFNFGFISILTYTVMAFFLKLIQISLAYIPNQDPQIEHTVPIVLVGLAGVFVMSQIPGLASALAGGAQVTTMGAVSSVIRSASRMRGGSGIGGGIPRKVGSGLKNMRSRIGSMGSSGRTKSNNIRRQ